MISGMDNFKNQIDKLQKNIEKLEEQREVSFAELFSPAFMSRHTDVSSLEELLQKGGLKVETRKDFENIPDQEMDSLVAAHTDFSTWNEMLTKAFEEWSAKQLTLGL